MKIFATLPAEARRALARRELARRGIASDVDRTNEREGEAITALMDALEALLPGEPVVYSEVTHAYKRWAFPQPPGHREKVEALARRIADRATTAADLAVLLALPADALATLGLSPEGFVTWWLWIDDQF